MDSVSTAGTLRAVGSVASPPGLVTVTWKLLAPLDGRCSRIEVPELRQRSARIQHGYQGHETDGSSLDHIDGPPPIL